MGNSIDLGWRGPVSILLEMATIESWKVFINHSRTAASAAGQEEWQGRQGLG